MEPGVIRSGHGGRPFDAAPRYGRRGNSLRAGNFPVFNRGFAVRDGGRPGRIRRARRPRSKFASGNLVAGSRAFRELGELAPLRPPDRAQRLARAPGQTRRLARRDLAVTRCGDEPAHRGGDLSRGPHPREIDAEKIAGVGLAGGLRQDQPQHRQTQMRLALDQRCERAGPGLRQQQSERPPPRIGDAGWPAAGIA